MTAVESAERAGTAIVASRLLILQSKQLMLGSAERRFNLAGARDMGARLERLRVETKNARDSYRSSVLSLESPESPAFWTVAYGRLMETGQTLRSRLDTAPVELASRDRHEAAVEVEALDRIIEGWGRSMQSAMTGRGA